ncbi:MAG: efflux RND transporter periplasmic adaptor subunit, partial [Eggerthellaceae bacterium]|nr:efflux RND transporter periplasmic adaptor subunit [Eggerthellaceae bacterium]
MVGKETTWTRKKKIVVGGVAALLAVALIGGGVARVLKMSGSQEDSGNVLTDTVQAGNISQTVTGAGSLASDKPVNVLVPADLEVVRVLVQEGDMVEVGTPIAEVSAASVQERQLAIEENIDSLQKQLDNLGWDTTHYELRKQVLEEQIADLRADRDAMIQLLETCTLTSDTAGEVGTVSLFEGVKTGKSSLRELQDKQQSVTQQDEGSQDGDSAQASQVSAAPGEGQAVTASMPTASMPTATVAVVRLDQSGPYAPTRIVADEGATDGEQANAKNTAEGQNSEDADANAFGSGNEDSNGETNEVSTENNEASNGDSEQSGGNDVPDSHAPEEIHGSIKLAVTPPVTGALPQDVLDL